MKTPSLVPSRNWNTTTFMEEAGLKENPTQSFGCVNCAQAGDFTPPSTVYMVNGTVFCSQHLPTVVD